jgi:diaminohydroxyphosphoribosylaminopyrimidine deaminase/5-amino-6-(5-phosphoribosylamino)uracil reductase
VIDAGIARVVIAAEDPTDLAGGGIEHLRQAGIAVEVGLCREAAETLNAPFYKHGRTGQPWVVAKWAQSLDGKLGWTNPPAHGNWISNAQSRADVHRLRKRVQAILTGIDTVLTDNPRLTVRIDGQPIERPPVRVVVDSQLRMPWDSHLITVPEAPTLVVTTVQTAQTEFMQVEKLAAAGVEVLGVPAVDNRCDLREMLALLGARGMQQILVEAGPTLIASFLTQKLVDEVRIYIAPLLLGANGQADITAALSRLNTALTLKDVHIDTFGADMCVSGYL